MADLVVFVALVVFIAIAGVALGMLAARRLGAWDERRVAAAGARPAAPESGLGGSADPLEDGGETVD